jgi:hypothetical protein
MTDKQQSWARCPCYENHNPFSALRVTLVHFFEKNPRTSGLFSSGLKKALSKLIQVIYITTP